ncbi:MAG: Sir2 silent information regulator family NAD-dependent deacetylase [Clostridiales bacterium]|nr:Sir2 silent information regulator family NAD-dependent deacetylase [Clostridiales bacterium]
MSLKTSIYKSTGGFFSEHVSKVIPTHSLTEERLLRLKKEVETADAIVIGAGAGLSASAGMSYSGERFEKYFSDFRRKYGITDMYSGGFYPFDTLEEYWAWWSRHIFVNRYAAGVGKPYVDLLELVRDKDYFVLTTNVDHQFQLAGFDKKRLFYTQGDYGLWQCSKPCHDITYENEDAVRRMIVAQGYEVTEQGNLELSGAGTPGMIILPELVPRCPVCGAPMTMNLRCDDTFVEDEGWHKAAERYSLFLRRHQNVKTLFLELGTGMNTPGIVKFSFWRMVHEWPDATYACINLNEAYAPDELREKAICINDDIGKVLEQL